MGGFESVVEEAAIQWFWRNQLRVGRLCEFDGSVENGP